MSKWDRDYVTEGFTSCFMSAPMHMCHAPAILPRSAVVVRKVAYQEIIGMQKPSFSTGLRGPSRGENLNGLYGLHS